MQDRLEPIGNLLIDACQPEEREILLAASRSRPITVGDVLSYPGDAISWVSFPTAGTLSIVAQPEEGRLVEAATVGLEGAAPVHAALGSKTASQELVGQVAGEMVQVPVETFAKMARDGGRFQDLIAGYIEALLVQISLSAGCNAVHHVNQRCARWLLQTHDRVEGDTFGLTQEYLGVMLGVQRPSVSIAAGTLQQAGCITYKRGSITVLDRASLEDAACPCYETIRTEYRRLVPLKSEL